MPGLGITMPRMGIQVMSALDALFSKTQQRVLGLIFGQPDRGFGINELIGLTKVGSGAVQREIKKLVDSGYVEVTHVGRDKRYRANARGFLFSELRSIVDKTVGVASALEAALSPARARIALAILFGSVAKGSDTALSDIDVLLVSDELSHGEALDLLASAEATLGRTVTPTVYSRQEFRTARRDPFLSKLLAGSHVVLIGETDAI